MAYKLISLSEMARKIVTDIKIYGSVSLVFVSFFLLVRVLSLMAENSIGLIQIFAYCVATFACAAASWITMISIARVTFAGPKFDSDGFDRASRFNGVFVGFSGLLITSLLYGFFRISTYVLSRLSVGGLEGIRNTDFPIEFSITVAVAIGIIAAFNSVFRSPSNKTPSSKRIWAKTVEHNINDKFLKSKLIAKRESLLSVFTRRVIDLSIALIMLFACMPLIIAISLAIKLESPGPVFYKQRRIGLNGRKFDMFKFRSMFVDADLQKVQRTLTDAPRWASGRDPRITRIGRFMRLSRIDELPQIINVILGDMTFVGPRPERPAFDNRLEKIIEHYDLRKTVKPGITGWAQVNYPYGASVEDQRAKVAYDLEYISKRSIFFDLKILFATVKVVLFQTGAR